MPKENNNLKSWATEQRYSTTKGRCWFCDVHPELSAEVWEIAGLIESGKSYATIRGLWKHLSEEHKYPHSESALRYHLRYHTHRRDEG
jgi:hypothetical protein